MKKIFLLFLFIFPIQSETSCSKTVICSFEILENLCAQLCEGTDIEIETIVPKGKDPHLFQPRPRDSKKISAANLVIINGLGLEGWIINLIKASGYKGVLVNASNSIKPRMLDNLPDPHIWHDPLLVLVMLENIKTSLIRNFPEFKGIFEKNFEYTQKLFRELNVKIQQIFKKIIVSKRQILTTHDAFYYFGSRYQIQVFSPQGISTGYDPSAANLKKLIQQVKNSHIKAIFFERLANPKILNIITYETKTSTQGTLYADNLCEGKSLQETILYNSELIANAMK